MFPDNVAYRRIENEAWSLLKTGRSLYTEVPNCKRGTTYDHVPRHNPRVSMEDDAEERRSSMDAAADSDKQRSSSCADVWGRWVGCRCR